MTRIVLEMFVRATPARCFDLARDIDLHTNSTGPDRERAVGGVTSVLLGPGDDVTWESRQLGMRWRMTSWISEFDRPTRFVDEMRKGPFKRWRHVHHFRPMDGGTRVVDEVIYRPLLWPLSWPLDLLFLRFYMRRLLLRRNRYLRAVVERERSSGRS